MAQVTVVGGGVVGLTAALGLARAGHVVRCVRDEPVADTVSAVAGGLWFPYHVEPRDRVLGWGRVAFERFTALAGDPDSGVALREGVLVERGPADRWWTEALPTWREARADELPAGATGGVLATVPLVTMPVFLPWLEVRCARGRRRAGRGPRDRPRRGVRGRRRGGRGTALRAAPRRRRRNAVARSGRPARQPGPVPLGRRRRPPRRHDLRAAAPRLGRLRRHRRERVVGRRARPRGAPGHRAAGPRGRARARRCPGARLAGRAAPGGARGAAHGIRARRSAAGDLLRARRRRGDPVVGLRRRGGAASSARPPPDLGEVRRGSGPTPVPSGGAVPGWPVICGGGGATAPPAQQVDQSPAVGPEPGVWTRPGV